MAKLNGKIAVITGGTQGLGAAAARHFADQGAAGIVTCGRSADKGRRVAGEISGSTACRAHFCQADLGSVSDCRNVIAEADGLFGRVDILVNAGATTERGTLTGTSEELFDSMFAVNVRGPFFLMQEAVKLMIRDGVRGAIVNIGSMSEHAGQPFITPYCMSKAALATLTRNAGFGLLRNNIRVNQLNIGWMASEGEDRIQRAHHGAEDGWLEDAAAQMPFGRLIDPAEVARAAAFLASDESGLMTGSVINFDQSVWGAFESAAPAPSAPMEG